MPLARLRRGFLWFGKAAGTSPVSRAYNLQETPQASTPADISAMDSSSEKLRREIADGEELKYICAHCRLINILSADGSSPFPINQLPPELLAEVFYWCILQTYACCIGGAIPLPLRPYAWLVIRHVCRAWREVALTFPKLSTQIWLARPECVQNLLSKSGALPLYIYDKVHSFMCPRAASEMFELVLAHFERVSSASPTLTEAMFNSNDDPVPFPVERRISRLRSFDLHMWQGWVPKRPLFLNFDFPALQDLTCMDTRLNTLREFISPGLTRLQLARCDLLLVEELLPMLKEIRGLEELVLERTIKASEGTLRTMASMPMPSAPPSRVTLSRLRKISIVDDWVDIGLYLIDRLAFPSTASMAFQFMSLTMNLSSPRETLLATTLAKLPSFTNRLPAFQTLSLLTTSGLGCAICLWGDCLSADCFPHQMYARHEACFSFSLSIGSGPLIAHLLRVLPLSQVQCAMLAEQVIGLDMIPWGPLLSSLDSLEDLLLAYETFDHLTPHPGPYQIRPADTHTLRPSLKTLRICESHHRSSLEWDFSPDLVHLGCIALGLASRQDPSTTLLGALAVTQEAILFHGMYGVCSCGGPAYYDQAYDFPSPNGISVDISWMSRYKARIMNCGSLISGTFKRR